MMANERIDKRFENFEVRLRSLNDSVHELSRRCEELKIYRTIASQHETITKMIDYQNSLAQRNADLLVWVDRLEKELLRHRIACKNAGLKIEHSDDLVGSK